MVDLLPELLLVLALILVNGFLAGSEIALISLREAQLERLEQRGGMGQVVATLARDPNRYLATIQIGITLAGFMASAAAAVTLAEPLVPYLAVLGEAADTVAVVVITVLLAYLTLVFGELAPKRLALQRAEAWALMAGGPLHWLAFVTKPGVWLLSVSTDLVVKILGGEPGSAREEINLEELREMVMAHRALGEAHQEVLRGAFEIADRTLREVMIPRPYVFSLEAGTGSAAAASALVRAAKSRAPVIPDGGDLDQALGVVALQDLIGDGNSTVARHIREAPVLPESVLVLDALRTLQSARQNMALVVNEYGGIDGLVTVEDLVEELVGEIYDEHDRDVLAARREPDGSIVLDGRYPVHDLIDLGIEVPEGDYASVAGLVMNTLGRVPDRPGDRIEVGGWELTVVSLRRRSIGRVRFRRVAGTDID